MSPEEQHKGKVIGTKKGKLLVELSNGKSCLSCSIAAFCSGKGNIIEISYNAATTLPHLDEEVTLCADPSLKRTAILICLMLPICALFAGAAAGFIFSGNDAGIAVGALAATSLYFLILWFMRHRLNRQCRWKLLKDLKPEKL